MKLQFYLVSLYSSWSFLKKVLFVCFCSDDMSIEINFQHSSNAKGIKALLLLSSFSIRCRDMKFAEIWNLFKIESTGIKKLATLLEKHFIAPKLQLWQISTPLEKRFIAQTYTKTTPLIFIHIHFDPFWIAFDSQPLGSSIKIFWLKRGRGGTFLLLCVNEVQKKTLQKYSTELIARYNGLVGLVL